MIYFIELKIFLVANPIVFLLKDFTQKIKVNDTNIDSATVELN